jgi:hypothetical protein
LKGSLKRFTWLFDVSTGCLKAFIITEAKGRESDLNGSVFSNIKLKENSDIHLTGVTPLRSSQNSLADLQLQGVDNGHLSEGSANQYYFSIVTH